MRIGYIRVSTQEQNIARQEMLMEALGVDEVYIDRMSGKNTDRPELKQMMEYVRRGHIVVVESMEMYRSGRNEADSKLCRSFLCLTSQLLDIAEIFVYLMESAIFLKVLTCLAV